MAWGPCMVKKGGSQPQRDNFVMIPRIVSTLGLSPFSYRLYCELKDIAGEDGTCYQSRETLAASCGMSTGQVTKAKQELVKAALIRVRRDSPPERGRSTGPGRGHVDHTVIVDVWHKNHAMYHQVALPIEPAETSPHDVLDKRSPDDVASAPKTSPEGDKRSPDDVSSATKTSSQRPKQDIDKEQDAPQGAKASSGTSIEGFRESMNAAETIQQRVAIVVDLVRVYMREPPKNPGGRAAALLKKYPDPGYVLQAVAQACVTPRAGNVFNYAEGILKGGSHGRRASRVEARRDPADFSRGWWGDDEPGGSSAKRDEPADSAPGEPPAPS